MIIFSIFSMLCSLLTLFPHSCTQCPFISSLSLFCPCPFYFTHLPLSHFLLSLFFLLVLPLSFQATHYSFLATLEVLGKLTFSTLAGGLVDWFGFQVAFLLFLTLSAGTALHVWTATFTGALREHQHKEQPKWDEAESTGHLLVLKICYKWNDLSLTIQTTQKSLNHKKMFHLWLKLILWETANKFTWNFFSHSFKEKSAMLCLHLDAVASIFSEIFIICFFFYHFTGKTERFGKFLKSTVTRWAFADYSLERINVIVLNFKERMAFVHRHSINGLKCKSFTNRCSEEDVLVCRLSQVTCYTTLLMLFRIFWVTTLPTESVTHCTTYV